MNSSFQTLLGSVVSSYLIYFNITDKETML